MHAMKVLIAGDDTDRSVEMARKVREMFGQDAEYFVLTVANESEAKVATDVRAALPPTVLGGLASAPAVVTGAITTPPDHDPHPNPIDISEQRAGNLAASAGLAGAHALGDVGNPRTAIKNATRDHDVDVVVVRQEHRSWVNRLFTSSVADDMVKSNAKPVLLMP
jgi:nucleotide-binding universal stress UspA family protein